MENTMSGIKEGLKVAGILAGALGLGGLLVAAETQRREALEEEMVRLDKEDPGAYVCVELALERAEERQWRAARLHARSALKDVDRAKYPVVFSAVENLFDKAGKALAEEREKEDAERRQRQEAFDARRDAWRAMRHGQTPAHSRGAHRDAIKIAATLNSSPRFDVSWVGQQVLAGIESGSSRKMVTDRQWRSAFRAARSHEDEHTRLIALRSLLAEINAENNAG